MKLNLEIVAALRYAGVSDTSSNFSEAKEMRTDAAEGWLVRPGRAGITQAGGYRVLHVNASVMGECAQKGVQGQGTHTAYQKCSHVDISLIFTEQPRV